MDLYARRIVGWALSGSPNADLVTKALDMACEQRRKPQGLLFHSDQGLQYGSRHFLQRLWRYSISQMHVSPGQLLPQLADGACFSKLENRVDTFNGINVGSTGSAGHQALLDALLKVDTT